MSEVLQTDKPVRMNSRLFLLIAMGMMSAFGPFVTDFYLPGLPALAAYFGTTDLMGAVEPTTSMMGLAGGQLILGPASDKYGRRRLLLISMALFIISTLPASFHGILNPLCFSAFFRELPEPVVSSSPSRSQPIFIRARSWLISFRF